jgi:hypothetical protein
MIDTPLIWPKYTFKTKDQGGKPFIFDPFRKKYVSLSPEEWVRQHVLNFLEKEKNYPKGLIRVESGLDFNSMKKRSDILVFDSLGKPFILVECKAPSVNLNQAAINQASRYNFKYKASILMVTNGLSQYSFQIFWDEEKTERIQEIPEYTRI